MIYSPNTKPTDEIALVAVDNERVWLNTNELAAFAVGLRWYGILAWVRGR